ncbi:uncharacterized protein LOC131880980 isoform X2 [Tigriopus californicus]|nr:uncharacterized protein LOC131880980 isoform X2 [Tigriopus californicus]
MTVCSFKMFCKYVLSVALFGSTFGLFHHTMKQECWAYVVEYLSIAILVGCQFIEISNHLPQFCKSKLEHRGPRVLSKNIARIGFQLTIEASSTLMLLYVALSTCSKEDETNLNCENGSRALVALFLYYTSVLSVVHLTMKIIFRLHVLKERKSFFEFKYPKYSDLQSRLESFPDRNEWKNHSEQRANEPGKNVADHITNCSFYDEVRVDASSRAIQVRNFQALSENWQSSESLEHNCGQNDGIISDKDRLIKDGHFFSSRWTDHKSLESTCFECGKINHPDFSKVNQQPKNPNDEIEKEMSWTTRSLSQGGKDFSNFALSFCVKVTEVEVTDSKESIINMKCPTCEHEEKYAIAKRSLRPCGYCDNSSPLSTKPASKLFNRSSFHLKAPVFLHNRNCPFRALVQERLANHCRHFLPPNRNQWPIQDFRIYDVVIALSRCYVISMLVLSFHWAGPLVGQRLWENCFIYGRILLLLLLSNITLVMDYALDHPKPSFLLLLVQLFTARGITFLKYVPDVLNSLYILYFGILSLFLMGQTQDICDSNVMFLSIVLVFSVAFNLLPIISCIKTECEKMHEVYDSSSEA